MAFQDMIGKTMVSVRNVDNESIEMISSCGKRWSLYHDQD